MANATTQGVPVTVHRPAFISNHSQTGHGNPTDYLNRYLAGCVQVHTVARCWVRASPHADMPCGAATLCGHSLGQHSAAQRSTSRIRCST